MISYGARLGLTPSEFYALELWELNRYAEGVAEREKRDTANCILTGYYSAYYVNGGKKSKSPDELIRRLYRKKQSRAAGLEEIRRVKDLEKKQGGKE